MRVEQPPVEGWVITIGSMVHGEDQGVSTRAEVSAGAEALRPGQFVEARIAEGARRRLRPVLMTVNIAAFGLVPLLFASGPGSEIQRPPAIVVIGGLLPATALTLILLPILYRRLAFKGGA